MRFSTILLLGLCAGLTFGCRDRDDENDAGTRDTGTNMDAGGGVENTAALCADNIDNDGDTRTDCNDTDCCDLVTCASDTVCGQRGDAGDCTPTEDNEDTEALCSNNMDDDCNGFADCNDFACCSLRDDCPPTSNCVNGCSDNSVPENTLSRCMDMCSNDWDDRNDEGRPDTFADCEEADCCVVLATAEANGDFDGCATDTFCGDRSPPVACPGDDLDEPPTRDSENSIASCTNSCDDDRNGRADCEDRNCCVVIASAVDREVEGVVACAEGTFCGDRIGTTPLACDGDDLTVLPMLTENTTAECMNGCDEDRNGFIDCGEGDCCLVFDSNPETEGADDCEAGTFCRDTWRRSDRLNLCDGVDFSVEPPAEETLELCMNDCDDDRNGFTDCDDFGCCEVREDCPSDSSCGRRSSGD